MLSNKYKKRIIQQFMSKQVLRHSDNGNAFMHLKTCLTCLLRVDGHDYLPRQLCTTLEISGFSKNEIKVSH